MKNLVLGGGEPDAAILIQHAPYRTGRKGKFNKTAEFSLATGGESTTPPSAETKQREYTTHSAFLDKRATAQY